MQCFLMNDLLNLERYSEGWFFQIINDNLGYGQEEKIVMLLINVNIIVFEDRIYYVCLNNKDIVLS